MHSNCFVLIKRLFIKLLLFAGSTFWEYKRGEGKAPSGKDVLCKTNSKIKATVYSIISTNKRNEVLSNLQGGEENNCIVVSYQFTVIRIKKSEYSSQ